MASQPPHSQQMLSPQFCFSTRDLKDFLRLSRSSIDDTITQHLNSLNTPAAAGFDASSTSTSFRTTSQRQLSAASCQGFKNNVLFPSWQARSDVINYCTMVATSPDPDDPESLPGKLASEREQEKVFDERLLDPYSEQEKVADERLDPYSARQYIKEGRTDMLASILRQERGVEHIVRSRSWALVGERCGQTDASNWEQALNEWRRKKSGL